MSKSINVSVFSPIKKNQKDSVSEGKLSFESTLSLIKNTL